MKRHVGILLLFLLIFLTACSDNSYDVLGAKVISKKITASSYYVTVSKDNSPYTFRVDFDDYQMVEENSMVDIYVDDGYGSNYATIKPSLREDGNGSASASGSATSNRITE